MQEETTSQKLYTRAKETGKVKPKLPWLKLAKKVIKENGSFGGVKGTGPHKVKFVNDRAVKGQDYRTKEERMEVEYIFEENGEQKRYRVPVFNKKGELYYFVERMKDFNYGDVLVLEYKKLSRDKGYIDIQEAEIEQDKTKIGQTFDEEIPIIEEDEIDYDPEDLLET